MKVWNRYLELMSWPGPLALFYAFAFWGAWDHSIMGPFFFLVATAVLFGNASSLNRRDEHGK